MIDFSFCPHIEIYMLWYVQASKKYKNICTCIMVVDRSSLNRFENEINFKLFEIQRSNIVFSCNSSFSFNSHFLLHQKSRRSREKRISNKTITMKHELCVRVKRNCCEKRRRKTTNSNFCHFFVCLSLLENLYIYWLNLFDSIFGILIVSFVFVHFACFNLINFKKGWSFISATLND